MVAHHTSTIFSYATAIFSSGLLFALPLLLSLRYGLSSYFGRAFFVGAVGGLLFTLAVAADMLTPQPLRHLLSSLLYLFGYMFIASALISYILCFSASLPKRVIILSSTAATLFFILVVLVLLSTLPQPPKVAVTVEVVYGLLDAMLLAISLAGIIIFSGGRLRVSWILIFIGIAIASVGDLLLISTSLTGTYYIGHPLELLYTIGYLTSALGFLVHKIIL